MAVDENIANYYAEHMAKGNLEFQLYQRRQVEGCSYGMISYNTNFTTMLMSFYESNDDQRDIMAMMGLGEHAVRHQFMRGVIKCDLTRRIWADTAF